MTAKISPTQDKPIDFLEEISNFTFASKYARYDEKEKRRETWDEAVARLEKMHLKRFNWLPKEDLAEIRWAFDRVREKLVAPSMRSLQFGGKAIEAHEARIFNCLRKDTKFITTVGVKTFQDFCDGDNVTVLTHKGNWKSAVVKRYGEDKLYPIVVSRASNYQTIYATKNHRWLLKDGTVTTSLAVGDIIRGAADIFSTFDYDTAPPDEKLYWAYGLVFGDGTLVKSGGNQYSMIRLCGHDKQYQHRFEELGFSTSSPLSCKGDFIAFTGAYLKTPPDPTKDAPRLIRAFVRGYCDADAAKNKNLSRDKANKNLFTCIQASDLLHIEFIRECFPVAGIYIVSEEDLTGQETNFGVRPYTIRFRITNSPSNLENSNVPFRVESIGDYIIEDTWCLEVEDDQSFTLATGLVTGNCATRHIDSIRAFAESFYLLLCGCGLGIGLSNRFLGRLPDLVDADDKTGIVVVYAITDSIEGWADSVEALLMSYFKNTAYTGRKIVFDYSKIRKKGSALKTGGGKAPGYKGLKQAHQNIKKLLDYIIEECGQHRMKTIDAYDILMHCADAVLSGGIRRSATSVVFELSDEDMMNAKTYFKVDKIRRFSKDEETGNYYGQVIIKKRVYDVDISEFEYKELKEQGKIGWWKIEPQRRRSNNSVLLLRDKVTEEEFHAIVEKTKQFGEPGFVFANHVSQLFNPCFEIGFIPVTKDGVCGVQFCNLTTQNGGKIDTEEKFRDATKAATIIGTLQAAYTRFPYLSNAARQLTEEEALLGLSITGTMDNPKILLDPVLQQKMAKYAIEENKRWAEKIGINQAARITCVKPEGTSSLVLKTASGIHPHHARRYFRRIQCNRLDNVYRFAKKINPHATEESIHSATKTDDVITFPLTVPDTSLIKADLDALKHLDMILSTQKNWVLPGTTEANKKPIEHNVSCTVLVKDDEWKSVMDFLYSNRQFFAAVSLLPVMGDKIYKQAPLEAVSTPEDEEKWKKLVEGWKHIDFTEFLEDDDETQLTAESACSGGACEIK
jgi:ribonucleoside-diphosphate reductase alpha chain